MSLNVMKNYLCLIAIMPFMISNAWANEVSFPGTGNEVGTADELLVYPGIDSSELTYNLGKKRTFTIRYGDNIDSQTFSAKINGVDITKKFHPIANTEENVFLRLKKGNNDLIISVSDFGDPNVEREPQTDEDNFTIQLDGTVNNAKSMSSPPPGLKKIELPPTAAANSKRPVFIDKSER